MSDLSHGAQRAADRAYDALDAFLTEHRLCRPGLRDPRITEMVVELWCACSARITVPLPPSPPRRSTP